MNLNTKPFPLSGGNMKKTILLLVMAGLPLFVHAADPVPGSPDAAKKIATDFLTLLLNVPSKNVTLGTFEQTKDGANLSAEVQGKVCALALVKHATANKYGWVVQKNKCDKK